MSKLFSKLSVAALVTMSVGAYATDTTSATPAASNNAVQNHSATIHTPPPAPPATKPENGTLTVKGAVVSSTCYLNTNSVNSLIKLPSVNANELNVVGKTAGLGQTQINLEGCPTVRVDAVGNRKNEVTITFDPEKSNSNIKESGNLKNIASQDAAKNVDIQLVKAGNPINLKTQPVIAKSLSQGQNGNISFTIGAQYIATGEVEPGLVESNVDFKIEYK